MRGLHRPHRCGCSGPGRRGRPRTWPRCRSPFAIPWPLAALAFFLGETNVVEVHFLRERHSFSLSELPGIAACSSCRRPSTSRACVLGTGLALLADRNQSSVRRAFNLAQFGLAAVVALTIFHAIATPVRAPGPREWLAAFAAAGVTSALEATLVATAISLSGGAPQFRLLPQMLSFSEMVAMANASLATLAVMVLWVDLRSIVLLAVPTAIVFVAYAPTSANARSTSGSSSSTNRAGCCTTRRSSTRRSARSSTTPAGCSAPSARS